MTASTNCDLSFGKRVFWPLVFIATVIISPTGSRGADLAQAPEPPIPERIAVTELPLPPTVLHPESETRRGEKNRGHSAVIMEMTDEQEKPI
jgi:hypothetical protein